MLKHNGWKDSVYYIDNEQVILVFRYDYHKIITYSAYVKYKDDLSKAVNITGVDPELMKLKCLIKAKELGWNINKVF